MALVNDKEQVYAWNQMSGAFMTVYRAGTEEELCRALAIAVTHKDDNTKKIIGDILFLTKQPSLEEEKKVSLLDKFDLKIEYDNDDFSKTAEMWIKGFNIAKVSHPIEYNNIRTDITVYSKEHDYLHPEEKGVIQHCKKYQFMAEEMTEWEIKERTYDNQ